MILEILTVYFKIGHWHCYAELFIAVFECPIWSREYEEE